MDLARSANGLMIHKQTCRYASPARHWFWADDKGALEVLRTMQYFGYETCLVCYPLPGTVIRKVR